MERARIESYEKMCQMNKFSKEYYLYPERIKEQEQIKLGKLKKELQVIQQKKLTPAFLIEELKTKNKKKMKEILNELDFRPEDIQESVKWMKLELFDSDKTEIFRNPDQLFDLFRKEEGFLNKIEAEVLVRNFATGGFEWMECEVLKYEKEAKKWRLRIPNDKKEVYYDGMNQLNEELKNFRKNVKEFQAERICFVFNFEDKYQFAERFIEANINRVLKDSLIRYSFYINAMIKQEETLGIKNKKRILDKMFRIEVENEDNFFSIDIAAWKKQIIPKLMKMFPSKKKEFYLKKLDEVDKTIENFYDRSINKVIFDHFYKKGNTNELIQDAELMLPMNFYFSKPAREKGIVDIYEHDINRMSRKKRQLIVSEMESTKASEKKDKMVEMNPDDEQNVIEMEEMQFGSLQSKLQDNFIFHEEKILKSLKLLNSLSLKLQKIQIFNLYEKEPLTFQMFKSLQEKTIYKFRDFLKYEWYEEVYNDLKRKITKKKLVEIDKPDEILGELIKDEMTVEETPKMKNIFLLKPKYERFLEVMNMKMKQELESVLVIQFGRFLSFLNRKIPSKIDINGIKNVNSHYEDEKKIEYISPKEKELLERSKEENKENLKNNNPLWFRPCLVSLLMNKVSLGQNLQNSQIEQNPIKETSKRLVKKSAKRVIPLFNAEVIVQDSKIKISERPEKFLKFINLIFEKTFRYFYKLQMIEFEVEEPCEKSLITRELIRGLRSRGQTQTNGNDYLFGWRIEGSCRISSKKTDCPKDYENWFRKNLSVIKQKVEANVKKVKQYQNMLGNLQKFIQFDFRAYLKNLGQKSEESVETLLNKIDQKKDEIQLIESLYPEEIDIGRLGFILMD
jgi:hypothetical protein